MTVQGLDQLISNLSALSKTAVPRATSQAVNRVAGRAISRSASQVSKSTRVPLKLVRGRKGQQSFHFKMGTVRDSKIL